MKINLISDLHIDHHPLPSDMIIDNDAEVTIIAGDLCAMEHWNDNLDFIPKDKRNIIIIPGNHCYYGATPFNYNSFKRYDIANISFLVCTLWTDFNLFNNQLESMKIAHRCMNDYYWIKYQGSRITPLTTLIAHEQELEELCKALEQIKANEPNRKVVVVTHHVPTELATAVQFQGDGLNPAFISNLTDIIKKYQPDAWCFGHTHFPWDFYIGKTRMLCNPLGYRTGTGYENPTFDINFCFNI